MLTTICIAALFVSVVALVLSGTALGRASAALQIAADLISLKEKFSNLDEKVVRSVMEEGGDASVEAVLQTMERIVEMDDGAIGTAGALKQARELHRR